MIKVTFTCPSCGAIQINEYEKGTKIPFSIDCTCGDKAIKIVGNI
jgi:predicted RNA-binding Zn-ribbon protein involved in translation (DUF1610 family)